MDGSLLAAAIVESPRIETRHLWGVILWLWLGRYIIALVWSLPIIPSSVLCDLFIRRPGKASLHTPFRECQLGCVRYWNPASMRSVGRMLLPLE